MIKTDCAQTRCGFKWQCSDCEYSSPYATSVKRHIESKHVGSVTYECEICQLRAPTKNALSVHKTRNHSSTAGAVYFQNKKFLCSCPSFLLSGLAEVDQLIRSKMIKDQGSWMCTDCQYVTKKSSNPYEHIESRHCSTSGYTCDICAKFCPTRNAMRNHNVRYHQTSKVA